MLIFPQGVCFFEMEYLKFQLWSWGVARLVVFPNTQITQGSVLSSVWDWAWCCTAIILALGRQR